MASISSRENVVGLSWDRVWCFVMEVLGVTVLNGHVLFFLSGLEKVYGGTGSTIAS